MKMKIWCTACKRKGKVYRPSERTCPTCGGAGFRYVVVKCGACGGNHSDEWHIKKA